MKKLTQQGSTPLVLFLAVAVIAAVGVVGYRVMNTDTTEDTTATVQTKAESAVPDTISSTADLNQAEAALNSTDIDAVNPSSLDSDLNAL